MFARCLGEFVHASAIARASLALRVGNGFAPGAGIEASTGDISCVVFHVGWQKKITGRRGRLPDLYKFTGCSARSHSDLHREAEYPLRKRLSIT